MTPIERVSARSRALALLGMTGSPSKSDIRKTFRQLALEKHPDHGRASDEEFATISEAYRLLYETAEDPARAVPGRGVRMARPSLQVTETDFDADARNQCESLLQDLDEFGSPHVATRLVRKGRMLTYFVPYAARKGLNRVALPTGDLVDGRSVLPRVLEIWSGDIEAGSHDVRAQTCAKLFPGARSVRIRFGSLSGN